MVLLAKNCEISGRSQNGTLLGILWPGIGTNSASLLPCSCFHEKISHVLTHFFKLLGKSKTLVGVVFTQ